jgi:ribose/xylose/arabinose/galactoside ABC-type transport system permease subunit
MNDKHAEWIENHFPGTFKWVETNPIIASALILSFFLILMTLWFWVTHKRIQRKIKASGLTEEEWMLKHHRRRDFHGSGGE